MNVTLLLIYSFHNIDLLCKWFIESFISTFSFNLSFHLISFWLINIYILYILYIYLYIYIYIYIYPHTRIYIYISIYVTYIYISKYIYIYIYIYVYVNGGNSFLMPNNMRWVLRSHVNLRDINGLHYLKCNTCDHKEIGWR